MRLVEALVMGLAYGLLLSALVVTMLLVICDALRQAGPRAHRHRHVAHSPKWDFDAKRATYRCPICGYEEETTIRYSSGGGLETDIPEGWGRAWDQ